MTHAESERDTRTGSCHVPVQEGPSPGRRRTHRPGGPPGRADRTGPPRLVPTGLRLLRNGRAAAHVPACAGLPARHAADDGQGFPLPVVGLVHTWIEITRHRTLRPADPLELTVYADGSAPHRRGTEVTLVTEARLAGELVWESRSGYLSRHATRAPVATGAPAPDPSPVPELPAVAEWWLPGDLGRRYGAASGDRNPIHLYALTARLFGFPRAIAHGMWTVARCLAAAPRPDEVRWVRADFRAPVLLPATVIYAADPTGFQLRGADRIHLTGTTLRSPGPRPGSSAATDGRS